MRTNINCHYISPSMMCSAVIPGWVVRQPDILGLVDFTVRPPLCSVSTFTKSLKTKSLAPYGALHALFPSLAFP